MANFKAFLSRQLMSHISNSWRVQCVGKIESLLSRYLLTNNENKIFMSKTRYLLSLLSKSLNYSLKADTTFDLSKEKNNIHDNQSVVIENQSSHHQLKQSVDDCIIAIWINEFLTLLLSIFTHVGTLVGILPELIVADFCSCFAN